MQQSRLSSLIEALTNVSIGMGVGLVTQLILFPIYNIEVDFKTNLQLNLWFTLVAIGRGYAVRRWFNNKTSYNSEETK